MTAIQPSKHQLAKKGYIASVIPSFHHHMVSVSASKTGEVWELHGEEDFFF